MLPNIITSFRLFLIPLFCITFFYHKTPEPYWSSLFIFILSGVSDVLDGYVARRWNMVTEYGAMLDPLADKLTVLTVLFCLSLRYRFITILLVVVFIKELVMVFGAIILYKKKKMVISAKVVGKISTFLFYIAIVVTLLKLQPYAVYLNYIATAFALFTFIYYLVHYQKKVVNQDGNL